MRIFRLLLETEDFLNICLPFFAWVQMEMVRISQRMVPSDSQIGLSGVELRG